MPTNAFVPLQVNTTKKIGTPQGMTSGARTHYRRLYSDLTYLFGDAAALNLLKFYAINADLADRLMKKSELQELGTPEHSKLVDQMNKAMKAATDCLQRLKATNEKRNRSDNAPSAVPELGL